MDLFQELDVQQSKILRMTIIKTRVKGGLWVLASILLLASLPLVIAFLVVGGHSGQFMLLVFPVGLTAVSMVKSSRNTVLRKRLVRERAQVMARLA